MLQITLNGKYNKSNGTRMLTYKVIGPKVEVDEYVATASAAINRTPDEWSKAEDGSPLFYVNASSMLQNGRLPQPKYTIIKNRDNTRYFIDDSAEEAKEWAEVAQLSKQAAATLMAERRYGAAVRNVAAVPQGVNLNNVPNAAPKDITDVMLQNIEEVAAVGNENLAD